MIKQLTIDYERYEKELHEAKQLGYSLGLACAEDFVQRPYIEKEDYAFLDHLTTDMAKRTTRRLMDAVNTLKVDAGVPQTQEMFLQLQQEAA